MEVKQKKSAQTEWKLGCVQPTHPPPPPSLPNNPYFVGGKGPPPKKKTDQRRNSHLAQHTARDDRGFEPETGDVVVPPPIPKLVSNEDFTSFAPTPSEKKSWACGNVSTFDNKT